MYFLCLFWWWIERENIFFVCRLIDRQVVVRSCWAWWCRVLCLENTEWLFVCLAHYNTSFRCIVGSTSNLAISPALGPVSSFAETCAHCEVEKFPDESCVAPLAMQSYFSMVWTSTVKNSDCSTYPKMPLSICKVPLGHETKIVKTPRKVNGSKIARRILWILDSLDGSIQDESRSLALLCEWPCELITSRRLHRC